MAIQETRFPFTHNAQDVGNAFVGQYYHVLHSSPKIVYQFYQETSQLSRLDSDGTMKTVTTLDAINDMIMSLNYEDYRVEIETADSQNSYEKGVIVLVTGCLTGKDDVQQKFVQTFFLAPQFKGGFYVSNDVLRFVNDNKPLENVNLGLAHSIEENAPTAPLTSEPVPDHVSDHHLLDCDASFKEEKEDLDNGAEVCDPSDEGSIEEELVETSTHLVEPSTHADQNETPTLFEPAPTSQDDAPKKSYASIVKVMKGSTASVPVRVATSNARLAAAVPDRQSHVSAKPEPQTIKSVLENSNIHEEAACHSIYIRNLPLNATVEQVGDAFIRFGPIKRGGIQVRSNKGFCFGFVDFESMSSMQSAIEASPIALGDRQIDIEEKRTTTRVESGGRGRFNSGRGGFRNNSFRSRGNFGDGGRGYGRNQNRNESEFSGKPRASRGRNEEGYQRVNHNGSGRGGHSQDGTDYTSVPA